MLRMSSITLHVAYSCQTISKTQDSFVNWTCRKLSHIFVTATFDSQTAMEESFKTVWYIAPKQDISVESNSEELLCGH